MNDTFLFGPFRLDTASRTLSSAGKPIIVGSRAFDILLALVRSAGEVLTRRDLMASAWPGRLVEESNVRVQVAHLRKALGCGKDGARYIASVAGRGYCFVGDVIRASPHVTTAAEHNASALERTELPQSQLPYVPAPLERAIGRQESVREVTSLVWRCRHVSVVGAGGSGKTTVAILAAHTLHDFGDAIFLVDLSLIDASGRVLEAIATAISFRPSGSVTVAGLAEFLKLRKVLLILDNCEHVIEGVAAVCGQLLELTSLVSILCTSREPLRVAGEHVYLLRPLASPPNTGKLTAEQSMAWPAMQLFTERAAEAGAVDALTDRSAATIAAICRRLDGNPLAIELVARRVGTFGIQGVSELLTSQAALRWPGRRDSLGRHQTVEAMLDWTYDLLPGCSRLALHRLSVFSGRFSMEAAVQVVADDSLDPLRAGAAISDLVDKSLVAAEVAGVRTRLRLLDTTRTYAAAKLGGEPDRDAVCGRHAAHYANELRLRGDAFGAHPGQGPRGHEDVLGNVRTALEWGFSASGNAELAVEMSALAAPVLLHCRLLDECERLVCAHSNGCPLPCRPAMRSSHCLSRWPSRTGSWRASVMT